MKHASGKKIGQHSTLVPVRCGRCEFLVLYMAAALLLGCHTRTTVQASKRSGQAPFQHIGPRICPPGGPPLHGPDPTGNLAFDRLNRELVACAITDSKSVIEPAWSVDVWYDDSDVYGERKEFFYKEETTLLFKELFQKRATESFRKLDGHPGIGRLSKRLDIHIADSLTLFNKTAAATAKYLYDNPPSPSGMAQPASLNATPFMESDEVMKLKFRSEVLQFDCSDEAVQRCPVEVAMAKDKPLEKHKVLMDPRLECSKGTPADNLPEHEIPMSCFYYVVVHPQKNFSYPRDYWVDPKKQLDRHDVVYLLQGFHLMKKADEPAWTWSTFWWTPDRRNDTVCETSGTPCKAICGVLQTATPGGNSPRPLACEAPWAFYAMDHQEYDDTNILAGKNPSHFNPYIERDTPSQSNNCIYCHARALYHAQKPSDPDGDFKLAITLQESAAMLPCFALAQTGPAQHDPPSLPRQVHPDVECKDAIPMHFLWSLAKELRKRQPPPPK